MRRLIVIAAVLFFVGHALQISAQQPIGVDANDLIAWDYDDAIYQTYAVTHFERSTDGGPWTLAAIAEQFPNGTGVTTRGTQVGDLPHGTHTVAIRVCNAVGCSSGLPFGFSYGNPPPPGVNPRILSR